MAGKGLRSFANVADPNTRQGLQNIRDVLNPILGVGVPGERAITQQELIDLGLVASDGKGGITNIVGDSGQNLEQAFLQWLEENFLSDNFSSASFTIGAEATDTINVRVQINGS